MHCILDAEELLHAKPACVSFQTTHCAKFTQKGAYVVLDFGKELYGGVRIELSTDHPVFVKNIYAINTLPVFDREAIIQTSDEVLNEIIKTAIYLWGDNNPIKNSLSFLREETPENE